METARKILMESSEGDPFHDNIPIEPKVTPIGVTSKIVYL